MRRPTCWTALGTILCLVLAGCGFGPGTKDPDVIKVGLGAPLSGPLAPIGRDLTDGADIAVDIFDDRGGVPGKSVDVVDADVPNVKSAVTEINRLIIQDSVSAVVCCYSSPFALAASQVTERNKVVMMEPGATAPSLTTRDFKYVLRTQLKASQYADGGLGVLEDEVAKKLGRPLKGAKMAIVHESGEYGTSIAKEAEKVSARLGIDVVLDQAYEVSTADLTSLVLNVKKQEPDILLLASYDNDAALFWEQARQQGIAPKVVIGSGGGHAANLFVERGGKSVEGVLESSSSAGVDPSALTAEGQDLRREFVKRYRDEHGDEVISNQVVLGFSGMWALLNVIKEAEDPQDPASIRAAAKKVKMPAGSLPQGWGLDFDSSGQNVGAFPTVQQWQDGKLSVVYPEKFATSEIRGIPMKPLG